MRTIPAIGILALAACGQRSGGLKGDEATANEAIRQYVERGEAAIPELKRAAADEDPLVRRRAKRAIGRITGQWGGEAGIVWKRSIADALGKDRPVILLHLFGEFDKEFC